jgi:flagellar biosynthesis protein FlhG
MRQPELHDQADGLRRMSARRPVKVIAVTSGKGGVGKTNVSVNLAVAMARMGRQTLLLDADLGLANADVMLGLRPHADLSQVLSGELDLEDILLEGPEGLWIVPAASGVSRMAQLSPLEQSGLISAFSTLPINVEVLVVDTAAGIDSRVLGFCQAAHEVLVVVCDEPASLTDAYALIKVLAQERNVKRFQILANAVNSPEHGRKLFEKLLAVCEKFLYMSVSYGGFVPEDVYLKRAVRAQKAVVQAYPSSPSARAFKELASRADNWPVSRETDGQPMFFLERVLQAAQEWPVAGAVVDVRN